MTPVYETLVINLLVTRVLHRNDDNDPTVILAKPSADKIVRQSLNVEVQLVPAVLQFTELHEINRWMISLYKDGTLTANHKDYGTIADDLSDKIADEYSSIQRPCLSIKILNGTYGHTYTYK